MKSLKLNFFMNLLLTVSGILFPLITFPYVSRVLGAEGIGKISFATSIITYFALVAQLGIPTYGIRICAQIRDNKTKLTKTVQELIIINFIMTIMSFLVFILLLTNVSRIQDEKILFFILSSTLIFNLIGMDWLYRSLEKYTYITVVSLFFKIFAIMLMFIFVNDKSDYTIYGGITIFAVSASNILNFINSRKYVDIFKIQNNYDLKRHLKPIMVFFSLSCATTIYTNLDTVLLGFFKDDSAVGYYSTAVRIKSLLLSVVTSLGVVLLPRLSYYVQQNNEEEFIRLTRKAFQFILIMSLSVTIYFILYAREGIFLLAGSSFENSILPMQIIMPTVILIGITNLLGIQILVPLGKEKYVLFSVIIGAVTSLSLNLILIPKFSYIGTAISNLVAETTVLIAQVYYLREIITKVIKNINLSAIFISVSISAVIAYFLKLLELNVFFSLVVSSVVFYLIYYVILKVLKVDFILEIEKQILKIIKRRL